MVAPSIVGQKPWLWVELGGVTIMIKVKTQKEKNGLPHNGTYINVL